MKLKFFLIPVYLLLAAMIFFFGLKAFKMFGSSPDDITSVAFDPVKPNIVWRVLKESGITEEYDVINKKVLRTIPKSNLIDKYSSVSDVIVTPKYIILNDLDFIHVYNKGDLSMYCTKENIGKLIGGPDMKISSVRYAPNSPISLNHYFEIADERGQVKYYDDYSDSAFTTNEVKKKVEYTPSISRGKFQNWFYPNSANENTEQKYFNTQTITNNGDFEIVAYQENLLPEAPTYLGAISQEGNLLWRLSLAGVSGNSPKLPASTMGNSLTHDNTKKSRIIDDVFYFSNDYKTSYKYGNKYSQEKLYFISAIDMKTGKILWFYDTYETSEAKRMKE